MSVLIKKDEKEKDKQTKDSIKFEMNKNYSRRILFAKLCQFNNKNL